MYPYIHSCSLLFSIHASAKEATCSTLFIARILACFSIHASAKEATGNTFVFGVHLLLFNPRLREGGDKSPTRSTRVAIRFSIHASAKEATYDCKKEDWFCNFQSTPPRRRRLVRYSSLESSLVFQSTPPRRRRRYLGGL